MVPIAERQFNMYALSLSNGPRRFPLRFVSGQMSADGRAVGAVYLNRERSDYSLLALRRRVDHRFIVIEESSGFKSLRDCESALVRVIRRDRQQDSLSPGEKRRRQLLETGNGAVGELFELLTSTVSHIPALMAIGEVYLAMPGPDDNFVRDFQTSNFNARLWELYLLAAFRDQGIAVTQPHRSPDFYLELNAHECWVEAVTTNPVERKTLSFGAPVHAPEDPVERLVGEPAERFAKTLRSKLQRNYEREAHVLGKPFSIAIADFHAPSSMTWSREALPSYLYGSLATVVEGSTGKVAAEQPIRHLRGIHSIPAGLFRDPSMTHLSAVIFSNAGTLGKFNRMGFLAGWQPPNLVMVREGIIFDRTPGALEPLSFKLDVLSDEYADLWPGGESWCQELEVFHNPIAECPMNFCLMPGATHWFERSGEIYCSSIWECEVLSSITHIEVTS